ncbi:MAG: FAD-dependent thymidylate synthase [Alphaproteobacteria bacterium]|nr:FAD-dependent thymidylate synthase [Alphaproteobacteria bacterium]MBF0251500.1 FAD-dependent thymidylate synthase [Alphaproteobacteria bacterium]
MADIFIVDDQGPEATAMLQALYSRSAASAREHLEQVKARGSAKFMESYYVGYGHASIGDCGSTTLFVEGLSVLACKAVQDNPLYSGQESSTRYIDFSKQAIVDSLGTVQSKAILDAWMAFYLDALEPLEEHLRAEFPRREGEKEKFWENAIKARGFDILRGFLPAGITSQLAWTTNLRQAADKLHLLRHHPLAEVRDIADGCLKVLREHYPSSFGHKDYPETEAYLAKTAAKTNYLDASFFAPDQPDFSFSSTVDNAVLEAKELDVIEGRPPRTNLPRYLEGYGQYTCTFDLDYGSYRDLQRHRNGICRIPLLTGERGFHNWYLDQLPDALRERGAALVAAQYAAIDALDAAAEDKQYYYPLGAKVRCQTVYTLPQMIYVIELRSQNTVHSTLRDVMHRMHGEMTRLHPRLTLHTDLEPSTFDVKRGQQTIMKRGEL